MSTRKSSHAPDRKADLRLKGWSLRTAAAELGVHWTHLHKVLSGDRHSASLMRRVESMPARKSA